VGGFGSGRYLRHGSRSKYLVADQDALRLDIRELYKDGLLDGDARGTITWFRHGRSVASIGTYSNACDFALRLDYDYGSPPDFELRRGSGHCPRTEPGRARRRPKVTADGPVTWKSAAGGKLCRSLVRRISHSGCPAVSGRE